MRNIVNLSLPRLCIWSYRAAMLLGGLILFYSNVHATEYEQKTFISLNKITAGPVISIDMRDVDRVLHFRIPKAYLSSSFNWKGGMQDSMSLRLIYPSMLPVTGSGAASFADILDIFLYSHPYAHGRYIPSQSLDFFLRNRWVKVGNLGSEFDLYVNVEAQERWHDEKRVVTEYLVPVKIMTSPDYSLTVLGNIR